MILARGLTLISATILLTEPMAAQSRHEIRSQPSCEDCSIEISHLLTLGEEDGPGAIADVIGVARDSRGRSYVWQSIVPHEILVFERGGRFLDVIGREGEGPGEYKSLGLVHVAMGDTLYLFDPGNTRITVLSPSWELVRTTLVTGIVRGAVEVGNGTMVVNARINTPDRIGLPLHLVNRDGEILRSFGAEEAVYRPGSPWLSMRSITSGGENAVWAAHRTQYVVERWNTNAAKLGEFIRVADWFPPRLTQTSITPNDPPQPELQAIRRDSRGLLWVAVSVADEDWKRALGPRKNTPEGPMYFWSAMEEMFDTIIEVIDPTEGRLLVSQRLPQFFFRFLDDNHIAGLHTDSLDVPYIDVYRVRLRE